MQLSKYSKEFKSNLQLAIPVILGMLGHTLVGIVDNVMVGHIGATDLAAASLANSFVFIAMSLGIGFSTAITPLIAEADAEKNLEKERTIFHHGLKLCALLGVFLFTLIYFSNPLLDSMGQPKAVVALAKPFLNVLAFSLIPLILFQGYKQFADGKQQTKIGMWANLYTNVVHILLNIVLIYGWWIFPKMGMLGAAYGTVISRFFMLGFIHFSLKNKSRFAVYFHHFSFSNFNKKIVNRIVNLGLPSGFQMFFEVALFTGAVWLCGRINTESQAANQIALSIATFTFMFVSGLGVAGMVRVGNLKGQRDFVGLQVAARSLFLLAIIVQTIFALLFVVFHNYLPDLFVNFNEISVTANVSEVVSIASNLILIAAVFQLSDGLQVVVLGALRGLQDVKIPMYITFTAYWLVGFPISIYLGLFTHLKAVGVWIGLLAGLTFAALFLHIRFSYLSKKLIENNII